MRFDCIHCRKATTKPQSVKGAFLRMLTEIVVDAEKVKREESAYKKIPVITDFTDEDGNDHMKETVQANYRRIKEEVKQIVQDELERIAGDDNLKHLLQQK